MTAAFAFPPLTLGARRGYATRALCGSALCGWTRGGRLSHQRVARVEFRRELHWTCPTMRLNSAIVGLPNVGKSTLFNALIENGNAQAANFPFCTIEPNVGIATVCDSRLDVLAKLNKSAKVVPTTVEVVDVAGLVKGAADGEGLGNQFLANIRECDAIVHVVRCFEDDDVVHVNGKVDAVRDIETIEMELMLADLGQVEKRLNKVRKGRMGVDEVEKCALEKLHSALDAGRMGRVVELSDEERSSVRGLGLLSMKPVVYAANVGETELASENGWVSEVREYARSVDARVVVVSAQVESELQGLSVEERREFLQELGVSEETSGLSGLVRELYELLGLMTYFTSGEKETRAWTIRRGMKASQAAGVIHADFERGFIKAETIGYAELCAAGGEKRAKELGKMRQEGRDYIVQDGDVMLFRFNV